MDNGVLWYLCGGGSAAGTEEGGGRSFNSAIVKFASATADGGRERNYVPGGTGRVEGRKEKLLFVIFAPLSVRHTTRNFLLGGGDISGHISAFPLQ